MDAICVTSFGSKGAKYPVIPNSPRLLSTSIAGYSGRLF
jgi:hypothetical protein